MLGKPYSTQLKNDGWVAGRFEEMWMVCSSALSLGELWESASAIKIFLKYYYFWIWLNVRML